MDEVGLADRSQLGSAEWRRIVVERDWDALHQLASEDVVYHNPAALEPIRGREALAGTLRLVFSAMTGFEYVREFTGADGVALEFTARVGADALTGVDLVRFNGAGELIELVVAMRPAGTVLTLVAEASKGLSV